MRNYQALLKSILQSGEDRPNRTGVEARGRFCELLSFDLREGFPLMTTKKIPFRSVIAELIGFIRGYRDVADFQKLGTKIWDANAYAATWISNPNCLFSGDLGRIYGVQWRVWSENLMMYTDQLSNLVKGLVHDPYSRRHVVTAWNPSDLNKVCLPPCHMIFQCYVSKDGYLDLSMMQRSCDMFLGVPFNIASYAALMHVLGHLTLLTPRYLYMTLNDVHIYHNHFDQVHELLSRTPYDKPKLILTPDVRTLDTFRPEDFTLEGYVYHPAIPAPMAV